MNSFPEVGETRSPFGNTKNLPLSIPQRLLGAYCICKFAYFSGQRRVVFLIATSKTNMPSCVEVF